MARRGIWSARTSGSQGHLVRKDIWPVGASGLLGHLARRGIWSVRTSGLLGHLADNKRLVLVEPLAVNWRLVSLSSTSGPKGHLRQRERWYI